jgi:hypothetical protein
LRLQVATPELNGLETSNFDVAARVGDRAGHLTHSPPFACAAPTWRIDYARNTYRIRVPRACFDTTEWVRVTFWSAVRFPEAGTMFEDFAGADDLTAFRSRRVFSG